MVYTTNINSLLNLDESMIPKIGKGAKKSKKKQKVNRMVNPLENVEEEFYDHVPIKLDKNLQEIENR